MTTSGLLSSDDYARRFFDLQASLQTIAITPNPHQNGPMICYEVWNLQLKHPLHFFVLSKFYLDSNFRFL